MELVDTFNAHLGSCNTVDLDPRGGYVPRILLPTYPETEAGPPLVRYLATGGSDSMINIFNNVEMLIHKAISETE